MTIGELTFFGIDATDFNCTLQMSPQSVGASHAEMAVFGGTVGGRFLWEIFAPDHTGLTFVGNVTRVRVEQLFTQFEPGGNSKLAEHVRADFTSSVDFYSDLDETVQMVLETLRMAGNFSMDQTTISGHPIQLGLAEALRANELSDLLLDSWTSAYRIENGVIHLSDVQLTSQDLALTLSGSQNLTNGEMDYRSEAILPRQWSSRLGGILPGEGVDALVREDGRLAIPLTIRGTSDSPRVGIDSDGIEERIENYARAAVEAQRREAEQQVREAASEVRDEAEAQVRAVADEVRNEAEERGEEAVDEVLDEVQERVPDDVTEQGGNILNRAGFP
jgi:hypothetical protein